jgi:glycosyltransferase involved in cell wall biosynthesis
MTHYPRISIITPSLNQGKFIRQTIESVLSQDYLAIEYIVMDGGSTDSTIHILKKYESRLTWVSKKDKGQADAINMGMKKATGDILCYLNSDDYFLPGTLSKIVSLFMQYPGVTWITGDYKIVNDRGRQIQRFIPWYKRKLREIHIPLLLTNPIIQPSTFWRRSLVQQIGLFDVKLRFAFDYDYWLRASKIGAPIVIPDRLSAFRIHRNSKGGVLYKRQFAEEEQVLRRYTDSKVMIELHKLHNGFITRIYDRIK